MKFSSLRLCASTFITSCCALSASAAIVSAASSQPLPEGNYLVSVRFGDAKLATTNWLKAEGRRLMLGPVVTAPGEFTNLSCAVNIRTPQISTGGVVAIKKNETDHLRWDSNLSLEVFTTAPVAPTPVVAPIGEGVSARREAATNAAGVSANTLARCEPGIPGGVLTVFLAGDSTVTDQGHEPWGSWGQCLPVWFGPSVAVANHAESGLTLKSFRGGRRLDKILSQMKKGDYLLIQFGHNDQKEKGPEGGAFKGYKTRLGEFVDAARAKGGIVVLVTPMERRRFDKKTGVGPTATLSDYAEAVRQVGKEKSCPVIDLNAASLVLYKALGAEGTKKIFMYASKGSVPGLTRDLADNTHHSYLGAYILSRMVVNGIQSQVPELAAYLRSGLVPFDPAAPASLMSTVLPPSGAVSVTKPDEK